MAIFRFYSQMGIEIDIEIDTTVIYDYDGSEIYPDLLPKPSLCVICKKDDRGGIDEIQCVLTRVGQREGNNFECHRYEPKFKR
ncbi:hypothetical protein [Dissulfurispira sp.]|uniref:hypothetical protein n=1 Tax=Dissulfurispira sp. TaxID=2817609 RepID=UPI002FDA9F01